MDLLLSSISFQVWFLFLFCHLKLAERISGSDNISMFERGTKISVTREGVNEIERYEETRLVKTIF